MRRGREAPGGMYWELSFFLIDEKCFPSYILKHTNDNFHSRFYDEREGLAYPQKWGGNIGGGSARRWALGLPCIPGVSRTVSLPR